MLTFSNPLICPVRISASKERFCLNGCFDSSWWIKKKKKPQSVAVLPCPNSFSHCLSSTCMLIVGSATNYFIGLNTIFIFLLILIKMKHHECSWHGLSVQKQLHSVTSITMVWFHDFLTGKLQRATTKAAFPQKKITAVAFPWCWILKTRSFLLWECCLQSLGRGKMNIVFRPIFY